MLQSFKLHLKIFFALAKHSLQRDLEYRLDFISNLISSVGWINLTLVMILVLNRQTGGFGDWDKNQMLLLTGVWMVNNGLSYFLFYRNMKQIVKDVHTGDLDYSLLKPLDNQFFVSFRRVILNSLVGPIEGSILIVCALSRMHLTPSLIALGLFVLLIIAGVAIYYSLWFLAASLSIHFTLADNLFYTVPELVDVSKFPPSAYPKTLMLFFSSVLPIIVMTAFPARLIMGDLSIKLTFYGLSIAGMFLFISRKFWYWSLRRYSSASS